MKLTKQKADVRNRLPQNVKDYDSAILVAKDIIINDIPEYDNLTEIEKKTVKNLLIAILLDMQEQVSLEDRTLVKLREFVMSRSSASSSKNISRYYYEMLSVIREEVISNVAYIIANDLFRYEYLITISQNTSYMPKVAVAT